ncbi:hypothetical protein [Streptomyces sp. HUAS TT20]|uniref:hypothetical protein n=1 Tax=Streptomyces sp. HUAS TT20 TaxID=3447509 RepID=UPI00295482E7|nr:hypothetical protein [Streptomyces sp. HUAS 15-9]
MPRPSRRTVLATGSALGGTLLSTGLPARATAAERAAPAANPSDPWRTVLDDADLGWQRMSATWHEGPFLGNGFLGSGIYAVRGPTGRRHPLGAAVQRGRRALRRTAWDRGTRRRT